MDIVPVEVFEEQCEENNERRNYDQKELRNVKKAETHSRQEKKVSQCDFILSQWDLVLVGI